jgi:DNA-binding transcriptional ArsR family regulator
MKGETATAVCNMRTLIHPAREDLSLPTILYALSDPLRLGIVMQLATVNAEISCTACYAEGSTAKSTISHHFRVLREAGITRATPRGRQLMITLRREDLEARFPGLLDPILQAYRATIPEEVSLA